MKCFVLGFLLLVFVGVQANGAQITIGVNNSGINSSYTYIPFDLTKPQNDPAYFKSLYVQKNQSLHAGVTRYNSWQQIVDSPISNISQMSTNDLAAVGVTTQTMVNWSNLTGTQPWVSVPEMALPTGNSSSVAYKLGFDMAKGLDQSRIHTMYMEDGNERWDGSHSVFTLNRSAANPLYAGLSPTEAMIRQAANDGWGNYQDFIKGAKDGGWHGNPIRFELPGGFIANPYTSFWAADELTTHKGVNVKTAPIDFMVAPYAPGSTTDIQWSTADSFATITQKLKDFTTSKIDLWIKQNKDMMNVVLGPTGHHLNLYEAGFGSMYYGGQYWMDYQKSKEIGEGETWWLDNISAQVNDPDAVLTLFGNLGNPWHPDFGEWDIWDKGTDFAEQDKSLAIEAWTAANGVNVGIPYTPEPNSALVSIIGIGTILCGRRRHGRTKKT